MQIDSQLLNAARAGDPSAMNVLLTDLRPNIRRYAKYQCARATAIDDVVQETLIIVNRRVGTLNNVAALGAWLAKIVTRLCLLPTLQVIRAAESLAQIDNTIDFSTRTNEDLRFDIARAIESLPLMYREIVIMRDFEELTINEMASRASLTPAAVKSRLHRARALVREFLVAGGHSSSREQ